MAGANAVNVDTNINKAARSLPCQFWALETFDDGTLALPVLNMPAHAVCSHRFPSNVNRAISAIYGASRANEQRPNLLIGRRQRLFEPAPTHQNPFLCLTNKKVSRERRPHRIRGVIFFINTLSDGLGRKAVFLVFNESVVRCHSWEALRSCSAGAYWRPTSRSSALHLTEI